MRKPTEKMIKKTTEVITNIIEVLQTNVTLEEVIAAIGYNHYIKAKDNKAQVQIKTSEIQLIIQQLRDDKEPLKETQLLEEETEITEEKQAKEVEIITDIDQLSKEKFQNDIIRDTAISHMKDGFNLKVKRSMSTIIAVARVEEKNKSPFEQILDATPLTEKVSGETDRETALAKLEEKSEKVEVIKDISVLVNDKFHNVMVKDSVVRLLEEGFSVKIKRASNGDILKVCKHKKISKPVQEFDIKDDTLKRCYWAHKIQQEIISFMPDKGGDYYENFKAACLKTLPDNVRILKATGFSNEDIEYILVKQICNQQDKGWIQDTRKELDKLLPLNPQTLKATKKVIEQQVIKLGFEEEVPIDNVLQLLEPEYFISQRDSKRQEKINKIVEIIHEVYKAYCDLLEEDSENEENEIPVNSVEAIKERAKSRGHLDEDGNFKKGDPETWEPTEQGLSILPDGTTKKISSLNKVDLVKGASRFFKTSKNFRRKTIIHDGGQTYKCVLTEWSVLGVTGDTSYYDFQQAKKYLLRGGIPA